MLVTLNRTQVGRRTVVRLVALPDIIPLAVVVLEDSLPELKVLSFDLLFLLQTVSINRQQQQDRHSFKERHPLVE